MPRIATIDIGSNAIRFALSSVKKERGPRVIRTLREPIRLGADVFNHGRVSRDSVRRMVRAFQQFADVAREHNAAHTRAVATAALREAANGRAVVAHVFDRTGISIDLITGQDEARLVHLAVASRVPLQNASALLIDIGGGSVEFTASHAGKATNSVSLSLGAVRLLEILAERGQSESDLPRLLAEATPTLRPFFAKAFPKKSPDALIATGGNARALGKLRKTFLHATSARHLHLPELSALVYHLQSLTPAQRVEQLNLRPDRADVILPAALILQLTLRETKTTTLHLPPTGLSDGLLLDTAARLWAQRTFLAR